MVLLPPRSKRTYTLLPYTAVCRSFWALNRGMPVVWQPLLSPRKGKLGGLSADFHMKSSAGAARGGEDGNDGRSPPYAANLRKGTGCVERSTMGLPSDASNSSPSNMTQIGRAHV